MRDSAVSQSIHGLPAIRQGPWKLIFGRGSGGWGKGIDEQPAQLYNLADDLAEEKNLHAAKPEIVAELAALMGKIVDEGRSTPGAKRANDVPFNWKRFLTTDDAPKKRARQKSAMLLPGSTLAED